MQLFPPWHPSSREKNAYYLKIWLINVSYDLRGSTRLVRLSDLSNAAEQTGSASEPADQQRGPAGDNMGGVAHLKEHGGRTNCGIGTRNISHEEDDLMEVELEDGDYLLRDGTAWFTVGRFSVRIHSDSRGVECRVFPLGRESEIQLAECVAYSDDLPANAIFSLAAFKAGREIGSVTP